MSTKCTDIPKGISHQYVDNRNDKEGSEYFMGTPMQEFPYIDDFVQELQNVDQPLDASASSKIKSERHIPCESSISQHVPAGIRPNTLTHEPNSQIHKQPQDPYPDDHEHNPCQDSYFDSPFSPSPLRERCIYNASFSFPTHPFSSYLSSPEEVIQDVEEALVDYKFAWTHSRRASEYSVSSFAALSRVSSRSSVLLSPGADDDFFLSIDDYIKDEDVFLEELLLGNDPCRIEMHGLKEEPRNRKGTKRTLLKNTIRGFFGMSTVAEDLVKDIPESDKEDKECSDDSRRDGIIEESKSRASGLVRQRSVKNVVRGLLKRIRSVPDDSEDEESSPSMDHVPSSKAGEGNKQSVESLSISGKQQSSSDILETEPFHIQFCPDAGRQDSVSYKEFLDNSYEQCPEQDTHHPAKEGDGDRSSLKDTNTPYRKSNKRNDFLVNSDKHTQISERQYERNVSYQGASRGEMQFSESCNATTIQVATTKVFERICDTQQKNVEKENAQNNSERSFLLISAPLHGKRKKALPYQQDEKARKKQFEHFCRVYKGLITDDNKLERQVDSYADLKSSLKEFMKSKVSSKALAIIIFNGHGNQKGLCLNKSDAVPLDKFIKKVRKLLLAQKKEGKRPLAVKIVFAQCHGHCFTKPEDREIQVVSFTNDKLPRTQWTFKYKKGTMEVEKSSHTQLNMLANTLSED